MREMYEIMDRWGAWAASDNSGVDWQPIAAGFKGLLPHGKKTRQQCDDDEGIMIDGCVARLRRCKPEEYELIIAHFVIGVSLRAIAKNAGVLMEKFEVSYALQWGLLKVFYV